MFLVSNEKYRTLSIYVTEGSELQVRGHLLVALIIVTTVLNTGETGDI